MRLFVPGDEWWPKAAKPLAPRLRRAVRLSSALHAPVPARSVILVYTLCELVANVALLPGGGGTLELRLAVTERRGARLAPRRGRGGDQIHGTRSLTPPAVSTRLHAGPQPLGCRGVLPVGVRVGACSASR